MDIAYPAAPVNLGIEPIGCQIHRMKGNQLASAASASLCSIQRKIAVPTEAGYLPQTEDRQRPAFH